MLKLTSRQNVYFAYQRVLQIGLCETAKTTGRLQKMTARNDKHLIRVIIKEPKNSLRQIRVLGFPPLFRRSFRRQQFGEY